MRILILGGYGVFGGRLVRLLSEDSRLTLIVAGRSAASADRFVRALATKANIETRAFDRDGDCLAQMRGVGADLVVDASGPFQAYGERPYRVAEAAIECSAHYLDLADGSAFVAGIASLDSAAKARRVAVLSGASTTSALTGAAFRTLIEGLAQVDRYRGGIAPSPHARIGRSVFRAISSYAGKPIALRRGGALAEVPALIETQYFTVVPPGSLPLSRRRFSLIDVPDLTLFAADQPALQDTWFGAGTAPGFLNRVLGFFARLVRWRLLPSLSPFSAAMDWTSRLMRWGEHRGGLFVAVDGRDREQQAITREFHLIAEEDDGPFVPALAAAALIARWLEKAQPAPGARPAHRDLALADFGRSFGRLRITSGVHERRSCTAEPLFRQILGPAFDQLAREVQALHGAQGQFSAEGRASVERGRGMLARLIAFLFRFPRAAADVPVTVRFAAAPEAEHWHRTFGTVSFESRLTAGRNAFEGLLSERFGPFDIGIAVVREGTALRWVTRAWTCLGVPLPTSLAPGGSIVESGKDGRFYFDVEIGQKITGLIVRYRGWLELDAADGIS
jgi:hypothetical protein